VCSHAPSGRALPRPAQLGSQALYAAYAAAISLLPAMLPLPPLAGIAALCAGGGERTTQIARVPGAGGGRARAGRGLGDRNKFASLKRGVIRSLRRAGVGRRGEGPSAAAPSELWDQDAWERTAAAGAQRILLSARSVLLARDM